MKNRAKLENFFQTFSKDSLHLLDEFYHEEAEFVDPVGSVKGIAKIRKYYQVMFKSVKTIEFQFTEFIESGETVVATWNMIFTTDKLRNGEPVVVEGNSIVKFANGKAIYHRDFYDLGALLYENLPVLGFMVKKLKERFKV